MDNEAPKYADWIPEAGGYVANGKVVSKSPLYDADGKLRLAVDTSILSGIPQSPSQNTQVANTLQGNVGVNTANIAGSGTDANAATTSIGSNASLNLNTANTDNSAISSPATKSNVTGDVTLSPLDKANQDYQDAAARNDYQGMINALTELGFLTGQDYSTQIRELTKKRTDKIKGIDDQYLVQYQQAQNAYNEAIRNGDAEGAKQAKATMNQLQAQQDTWRGQVGYENALKDAQQIAEEDLQIEYETSYMTGVNDICNQLMQMYPQILNFQYNPATDASFRIASGYATSAVKEQANATGMYYSSFTQSAIAKAVAELIPTYAKMKREELVENFNLLQSTASFLMNLEQTQFNMWATQLEMQWKANDEKRKQWQQALDASNARGWVNNEEAMWLGVEPGSLSKEAQDHARDLQEEIDKEQRQLEQQKILAKYNMDLDIIKMREEYRLKTDYALATGNGNGGNGSSSTYTYKGKTYDLSGGTLSAEDLSSMYESYVANGYTEEQALEKTIPAGKNNDEVDLFMAREGLATPSSENASKEADFIMVGPLRIPKSMADDVKTLLENTSTTSEKTSNKNANAPKAASVGTQQAANTIKSGEDLVKKVAPDTKRFNELKEYYNIVLENNKEYGDDVIGVINYLEEEGDITAEESAALAAYYLVTDAPNRLSIQGLSKTIKDTKNASSGYIS